jgi:hypothetical protein
MKRSEALVGEDRIGNRCSRREARAEADARLAPTDHPRCLGSTGDDVAVARRGTVDVASGDTVTAPDEISERDSQAVFGYRDGSGTFV